MRVVVIGGGLAGLATALELVDRGIRVTVVEAQERVGGRILTLRDPFHEGLYVEAGATHVVGDPALLALAERVGVEVTRAKRPRGLAEVQHIGGKRRVLGDSVEAATRLSAEEIALGWEGRMRKYFAAAVGQDPRLPSFPSPELAKLDHTSIADHLRAQGASEGFIAGVGEGFCPGGDATTASALSILRDIASLFVERGLEGGGRFAGGSDRLPRAIAERLGQRVLTGARVRAVSQDDWSARVELSQKGKREVLEADFVVCAVPSPVLGDVRFSPALSAAKLRAIRELPLASVTRVFVECGRRFWIEQGESGRASTDLEIGTIRHETELLPGPPGILGAYLTAARAERFGRLAPAARIERALADIDRVFPGMRDGFTGGASHAWHEDEFARGAYAWYRPAQLTGAAVAMAEPEGRVHFAGDHTSYRPGFMHGALASARRVVGEIASKIG